MREPRSSLAALSLVVTSFVLGACAHDVAAPTPQMSAKGTEQQLAGTVWKWTESLFNDDKRWTPADPNTYHIEFTPQGTVSVRADCNRAAGMYTTDGHRLTITLGPSTQVACPPGSLGDEYVRQLGMVTSYLFHSGNLVLEFSSTAGP